jgi:hypothetical protein
VTCGHAPLFVAILPLAHWHPRSGYDRANRIRQAAIDRAFMNSGRVSDAILDMLERLESKPRPPDDRRSCLRLVGVFPVRV